MWPPIHRARLWLAGDAVDDATLIRGEGLGDAPSTTAVVLEDIVLTMGSHDLDRLRQALQRLLGSAVDRPDTPARIERALVLYLASRQAPGRPRVLRRPAVIMAPESWEICLDETDRGTVAGIRDASRTGRFA